MACRVDRFAAVAGPWRPPSRPGEPQATTGDLLLVQEPQYQVAEARS